MKDNDSSGNRYICQRCGNCCRWAGYVRLREEEVVAVAAFLGITVADFTAAYTAVTADRRGLTLIEKADGGCIFLTGHNHCRIEAAKPSQCRGFPNRWNFPGFRLECEALDREEGNADG